MARSKFGIDFDGFLELAERIDNMGEGLLRKATENALAKSAQYANKQVENAMKDSPYQFYQGRSSNIGVGGIAQPSNGKNRKATGNAKKSAHEVSQMPIEWEGNTAMTYVGVSWRKAPEVTLLAFGTPHIQADKTLQNAIKVKGKVKKEASKIQQEEFLKVLKEAQE